MIHELNDQEKFLIRNGIILEARELKCRRLYLEDALLQATNTGDFTLFENAEAELLALKEAERAFKVVVSAYRSLLDGHITGFTGFE